MSEAAEAREPVDEQSLLDDFPPVVYVPCEKGDDDQLRVTLRETADGRKALLVYTALDRLRDGAGRGTPWALLTVEDLQRVHDESAYEVIYQDILIPEELR